MSVADMFKAVHFVIAQVSITNTNYEVVGSSATGTTVSIQARKTSDGTAYTGALMCKLLVLGDFK